MYNQQKQSAFWFNALPFSQDQLQKEQKAHCAFSQYESSELVPIHVLPQSALWSLGESRRLGNMLIKGYLAGC